jgi:protein-S-isoprenylcysteine O-methyltransferase Ste14
MSQTQEAVAAPRDDRRFMVRFRTRLHVLIPILLLLTAMFWGPDALPLPWLLGGVSLVLLGVAVRMWAAGYLRKQQVLVCWGPFAYVRNPLYLGSLFAGCGLCLLSGRWETLLLVGAATVAIYHPTILHEERKLGVLFGDTFRAYCGAVPRWLPRLFPYRCAQLDTARFEWTLVRQNHEDRHAALVGLTLALFGAIYLLNT